MIAIRLIKNYKLYEAKGYDGHYDESHGSIVFFEPQKFLKLHSVNALGPRLKNQKTMEIILKADKSPLKLL